MYYCRKEMGKFLRKFARCRTLHNYIGNLALLRINNSVIMSPIGRWH